MRGLPFEALLLHPLPEPLSEGYENPTVPDDPYRSCRLPEFDPLLCELLPRFFQRLDSAILNNENEMNGTCNIS